jgi:hypothetical protein
MERERRLAEDIRSSRWIVRRTPPGGFGQQSRQNPSMRHWWKGGPATQAIGNTKGGRNTKIHAVVDDQCRPWVLVLTPGNTNDCVMAEPCVSLIGGISELNPARQAGLQESQCCRAMLLQA